MPNWCWQFVTVKGKKEDLQALLSAMRTKDDQGNDVYGLNHLYPCPEELANTRAMLWSSNESEQAEIDRIADENVSKFGYKDWYGWANANWGTKWGACDVYVENESQIDEEGELTFRFESAWSPATGLLTQVSAQFPDLIIGFYCREEAEFFATMHVFHEGKMTHEDEVDLSAMPEMGKDKPTDEEWDKYYEEVSKWNSEINDTLIGLMETAMDDVQQGVTA
jgi:hypothetical protein